MATKETRKTQNPNNEETEENKDMNENEEQNVPEETETNEAPVNEGKIVYLPAKKKGGFLSDLGLGAKIGLGLVFTGVGVGLGFLLKGLLGGKDDDHQDAIPVEGSVSDSEE